MQERGLVYVIMKIIDFFRDYLWDEKLDGNILCEGAQGFWLDINYGNYPYVTSSNTLPYGCCSLGFSKSNIQIYMVQLRFMIHVQELILIFQKIYLKMMI